MTKPTKTPPTDTRRRAAQFRRLTDRTNTTVTSVVLPIALHDRAALAAVHLNWPLAEIVRQALTEWLDRRDRRITR